MPYSYLSKYSGQEIDDILDSVSDKQDTVEDLATIRQQAAASVPRANLAEHELTFVYDDDTKEVVKILTFKEVSP